MNKTLRMIVLCLAATTVAYSCKTVPKGPGDAAPSTIEVQKPFFAPLGSEEFKKESFALNFGNAEAVRGWKLEIVSDATAENVVVIQGGTTAQNATQEWDGTTPDGKLAPEGSYHGRMTIDYGTDFKGATLTSNSFTLVSTAPSITYTPNPVEIPYSSKQGPSPLTFVARIVPGTAQVVRWTLALNNETGDVLRELTTAWPSNSVTWDARFDNGLFIEPGKTYTVEMSVFDEYGNAGATTGTIVTEDKPLPRPSSIAPDAKGFSPATNDRAIGFALSVGEALKADTLSLSIEAQDSTVAANAGMVVRTIKIEPGSSTARWDGMDDKGAMAPDGHYKAVLAINYGKEFKDDSVASSDFVLVSEAPKGTLQIAPDPVVLGDLTSANPVSVTIDATSSYAQIDSWMLDIKDGAGKSLATMMGKWPEQVARWNGRAKDAMLLAPGTSYLAEASVRDEFGNVGHLTGTLKTAALTPAPEVSSIKADKAGFSPGSAGAPEIGFMPTFGSKKDLVSWKLELAKGGAAVVKTIQGKSGSLPARIPWNGLADNGKPGPEGQYNGILTVDYGFKYGPTIVRSEAFIMSVSAPTGSIRFSTDLFAPVEGGPGDKVTITMTGNSNFAKIKTWTLVAKDPGGNTFASWQGSWPAPTLTWDGKGKDGSMVESASDYPVTLTMVDEYGKKGTATASLATGILLTKTPFGYRIRISSIVFKPFTADYVDVPADRAARNQRTIMLLAEALKKFPDYKIKLEGHAVMVYWNDKARGAVEQKNVLVPLSQSRADAIKAALAAKGINPAMMTALGVGAENPVVPDSDPLNRWKNRRVDFYLLK